MIVYSCSGPAFDDTDLGEVFYRTKAEAVQAARSATGMQWEPANQVHVGSRAIVRRHHVNRTNHDRIVAMLNHQGWCDKSEEVAFFENGEQTKRT